MHTVEYIGCKSCHVILWNRRRAHPMSMILKYTNWQNWQTRRQIVVGMRETPAKVSSQSKCPGIIDAFGVKENSRLTTEPKSSKNITYSSQFATFATIILSVSQLLIWPLLNEHIHGRFLISDPRRKHLVLVKRADIFLVLPKKIKFDAVAQPSQKPFNKK